MAAGRCRALLVTSAILAGQQAALAEAPAPHRVTLTVPQCERPPFSRSQLLDALAIELRQEGVQEIGAGGSGQDAAVVEIRHGCGADLGPAVVRIADKRSSMARVVDVGDIEARSIPRALALVAAELARSMWARARPDEESSGRGLSARTEVEDRGSPASTPAPAERRSDVGLAAASNALAPSRSPGRRNLPLPQPKEPRHLVTEEARREALDGAPPPQPSVDRAAAKPPLLARRPAAVAVMAGGQASVYVQHPTTLWGGAIAVALGRVRAGVLALTSADRDVLGQVRFTLVAGEASMGFMSNPTKRIQWRIAPRFAAGQIRAVADSVTTSDVEAGASSELYLEGGGEVGLGAKLALGLRMELSASLAYALGLSAKADERVIGVVAGPCASLRLALGIDLSRP